MALHSYGPIQLRPRTGCSCGTDMCTGMHKRECADTCPGMYMDLATWVGIGKDMFISMVRDTDSRQVHRHGYRRVYRHVCRHVDRHGDIDLFICLLACTLTCASAR